MIVLKLITFLLLFLLSGCARDSSGDIVPFDATFTGTITDASNGNVLSGASIYVQGYSHVNTRSNGSGEFTLRDAPAAMITLMAFKNGYEPGFVIKTGRSNQTTGNSNISLLPEGFGNNKTIIILTWAATPADLDGHLYVGDSSDTHIKFDNKGDSDGTLDTAPFAGLDVDDTNGNGPETITIRYANNQFDYNGTYRFFVHNFTGTPDISASDAVVTVYQNSVIVQSFEIPTSGTGQYWHVFDMDRNGEITSVNTIQAGEPTAP